MLLAALGPTRVALGQAAVKEDASAPELAPMPEAASLSYRAPEHCPSVSDFLTDVRRSTARIRWVEPTEAARRFEVVIAPDERSGHLSVNGGALGVREVQGSDCVEVSRLLAFATALAADPEARIPDGSSSVAAIPPPSSTPERVTAVTPTATPSVPAATPTPAPRMTPPTRRTPARRAWSLAGFGFAKGASAPGLIWGGGAFAELALSTPLAPRLRAGFGYDEKTVAVAPGHVVFRNEFIALELCSGRLQRAAFRLLPCLRAEGGARTVSGDGVPQARAETRGFLAFGPAVHLRWRSLGPWFGELGGALLVPAVRDRVFIQPDRTVYRTPSFGALSEISLGFEFGDQNPN